MSTRSDPALRTTLFVTAGFAVVAAGFLLLIGLGLGRLPYPPGHHFSDAVTSHWSSALFLRRSVVGDHALPLWRPLIMSGQPFAANPLNKVWYPPQWLVLLWSPVMHLNVLLWLHLVAAGSGAWLWGRRTGLLPWAALLAAGGYVFAPRVVAALGAGHLDLVYAAAWLPWLLWAVHRMTEPDARLRSALWSALFAALALLADVRLGAYALVLAFAYIAWCWWAACRDRTVGRLWWRVVIWVLLVISFTAPVWVPLLLYRADLSRGAITLEDAAVSSLSPGQWAGVLFGDHGGSWESMVYVGISTLALALVTLIRRPRQFAFWWVVVLLAALYAMGDQFVLWPVLNRLFPFLRWWRVPPRVWLIAAFVLPYLAGWGAQLLVTDPPDRRGARLGIAAVFGGGMACGAFSLVALSPYLKLTAILGTFALPLVALVMLLVINRRLAGRVALVAFTLIVLLDVLWIDRTLVEGRDRRDWLDPYRTLATYLQDADATRVYSPSYSLPQHAAAYWSIPLFGGVDPFQFAGYVDAFAAAAGTPVDAYTITLPPYALDDNDARDPDSGAAYEYDFEDVLRHANRDAVPRPDMLAQWRVSHVVAAFPLAVPGLEFDTRIGDVFVYRNRAYTGALAQSSVLWDGPNRVTVRVPAGIDGMLYAVANGRWQNAPAGNRPGLPGRVSGAAQEWTFTYDRSEVWYSLGALVLFGVLAVLAGWRAERV